MSPGGAFTNTVLRTPLRKLSSTKLEMDPSLTADPKKGSQRRPAFIVTRSVARHASEAYSPRYVCSRSRNPGALCSNRASRPVMKSVIERPVTLPLNSKSPMDRALISWKEVQYAMLAPADSWWRPRIIVRSSAIWYVSVSNRVFVSYPPGVENAPLTVRAMLPGT